MRDLLTFFTIYGTLHQVKSMLFKRRSSMFLLGQPNTLQLISTGSLISGIVSALFSQPDFGLILVATSAFLAYWYSKTQERKTEPLTPVTSVWQQGRFTAGQEVLHFGRQAQVVAVPVRIVPRNHVPVSYIDESENRCFKTVPWSELQHPRNIRID